MKTAEHPPLRRRLILAVAFLVLPSPVTTAGLKLRRDSRGVVDGENVDQLVDGANVDQDTPVLRHHKPPAIRPGVAVRVTPSKDELKWYFEGESKIRYDSIMDEMLGKVFVVKKMKYGGAGLRSPDGHLARQSQIIYFPKKALTPWLDTPDAGHPAVPGQAMKAVGLPSDTEIKVRPPGPDDAPWAYTVNQRGLMDPIAPPYQKRINFEKTAMRLPPFMKVKQVASIDCLEKMHMDPKYLCEKKAYVDHKSFMKAKMANKKAYKHLSRKEHKALEKKIKHLKHTIKRLSPKVPKKKKKKRVLHFDTKPVSLNRAGAHSNHRGRADSAKKKMRVGIKGSHARMNTANGRWQKLKKLKKTRKLKKLKHKMHNAFHPHDE